MCGIVGAVAQRPIVDILLEGLRRLEYRGYDSAGVAVINTQGELVRARSVGKVAMLEANLAEYPLLGNLGIAHTRWATHGVPAERNAHPHFSNEKVGLVHNGIIENHAELREQLKAKGYVFTSDTDTEVVAHLIADLQSQGLDLFAAVLAARSQLQGAYALAIIAPTEPESLIVARQGSPLVIGLGIGESFIGSDIQALLPVTNRFIYLENGDVARVTRQQVEIVNSQGQAVDRPVKQSNASAFAAELGTYRHFMLKEIYEQPAAIAATLEGRLGDGYVLPCLFGVANAMDLLAQVEEIQIIACGTSFHAGLVARYWIEAHTNIPCSVEVASEYRYRRQPPRSNLLFVTISQSGETADTLAALEKIKANKGALATLTVCNVPESSLTRESDMALMTVAGPEIGVASTKAFTTQLVALQLLMLLLKQAKGADATEISEAVNNLRKLPALIEQALDLNNAIEKLAESFIDKQHSLFLGRGELYPIAMEGALKLKEISYIHAEAYPAGELKHGPLALVDAEMPIVTVAPNSHLLEKLKSNLEEVRSRGGVLYVFADKHASIHAAENVHVLAMPRVPDMLAPIVYTLPLQLLSYHVAVLKGTDVDKPRNLAKSVTVE